MNKLSVTTTVIRLKEKKSPYQVKAADVTTLWKVYLGKGNYNNIQPRTGTPDPDRIFSADGTRSIRFGWHEMKLMGREKFHYHEEVWIYDSNMDTLTIYNTCRRIQFKRSKKRN